MDRTTIGLATAVVIFVILAIVGWAMFGAARHKAIPLVPFDAKNVRILEGIVAADGDIFIDDVIISDLKMPIKTFPKSITFRNVRFSSSGVSIYYTGPGLGRADNTVAVGRSGKPDDLLVVSGPLQLDVGNVKSFRLTLADAYVPADETFTITFKQ